MSWERDPRSGALLHKPDRHSEHVVPAWAIAGLGEMMRFGHTAEELRPYGLLPPVAGGVDAHANFAYSTVLTAPSPALSGTSIVLQSGDGALFPAVSFNAVVCPVGTPPRNSNAEIVRCTARPGAADTFTITRGPQAGDPGGINRTIVIGDQFFAAPTKKTFTDIEVTRGTANAHWTSAINLSDTTVVSHGLGATPTVVLGVCINAATAGQVSPVNTFTYTSTQFSFNVEAHDAQGAGANMSVGWVAFL